MRAAAQRFLLLGSVALGLALAACGPTEEAPPARLYFAVTLARDGDVIARPNLLGLSGVPVRVERRSKLRGEPDYRLRLLATGGAGRYRVELISDLRDGTHGEGAGVLRHGGVRTFPLGEGVTAEVTLLEVDSPEFDAWMRATDPNSPPPSI